MNSPGATGGSRIWRALGYSWAGLKSAYQNEAAFRQEVWIAAVLLPAVFFLPASAVGKALMIGSVLLVLVVELLNSAIEAIVDLASPAQHQLAGRAKDVASAAVLVALINVVVVWVLVLML